MRELTAKINYTIRYTVFGFLFGAMFPLFGTFYELLNCDYPFSIEGIFQAQANEPLLWTIDTAPFVLGLFAWLVGQRQDQVKGLAAELETQVLGQTAELRQSEERYRSVVEIANDAVVSINHEGNVIFWNRAAEKIFGYAASEIIGKPLTAIMPEQLHVAHQTGVSRVVAGGDQHVIGKTVEIIGRRKDGTDFPVEFSLAKGEIAQRVFFTGILRDITARKQAEKELHESRERFELAVRAANDGIWDWRIISGEQYFSPRWKSMLGYADDEIKGSQAEFEALIHPNDLPRVLQATRECLDGETPTYEVEMRMRHKDGSYRWILSRGMVLRDEQGNPHRMAGSHTDITESKENEFELARQKQYFESLVQNSPVAIVVLDLQQRIASCNPAFENLFGYSYAEVVGRDLDDLISPDQMRAEAREYTNQVMRGGMIHGTGQRKRKDGSWVTVEIFGVPVIVQGERVGVLGLYHDISELVSAREQAESADQAKSAFLAAMSHEIRTPLNGIIGMTSLLLDTPLDLRQKQFADTIRFSGENLLTIINDILDFSKIEAGRMDLENTDFDLQNVIESIGALFAERAYQKKLELITFVDTNIPPALCGDPFRLGQILTNLMGNAIKFTERGEIALSVTLVDASDQRVLLKFAVRDTGIGITPEQQDRLFKPFMQADTSTTRKYGGTGLGLAISNRLVEIMGGQIKIDSQLGQGSTFFFVLSFELGSLNVLKKQIVPADLRGVRVLIVDDNDSNREVLHHQVIAWGMLPQSATNAREALVKLRASSVADPFRVVLLDMEMPGMDGIGLAGLVRNDPALVSIKLILLTSVGRISGAETIRQMGLDASLVKPVRQSELFDCLISTLGVAAETTGTQVTTPRNINVEGAHRRVLLAEDNAINQQVAVYMLESRGYRVDVVGNGLEALETLTRSRYDLVLMDCQMPEMDGYEATSEIRRREGSTHHTPIIALTAHALHGERDKCIAAGMDDYLAKPITPETLFPTLRRWLPKYVESPGELSTQPNTTEPVVVAQGMPIQDEVLDRAALTVLRKLQKPGMPNFLDQLIDLYLQESPGRVEAIHAAVQSHDAAILARAAHSFKGSSASIAARQVSRVCAELEAKAKASDWTGVDDLFAELKVELKSAQAALLKERGE